MLIKNANVFHADGAFKRGDILTAPGACSRCRDPYIFVLDMLCSDDPVRLERALCGKVDISDMIGWGFFADADGAEISYHLVNDGNKANLEMSIEDGYSIKL